RGLEQCQIKLLGHHMLERAGASIALDGDRGDADLARLADRPLTAVGLETCAVLLDQSTLAAQNRPQIANLQGSREDVTRETAGELRQQAELLEVLGRDLI